MKEITKDRELGHVSCISKQTMKLEAYSFNALHWSLITDGNKICKLSGQCKFKGILLKFETKKNA
jgi:hypothetical protein